MRIRDILEGGNGNGAICSFDFETKASFKIQCIGIDVRNVGRQLPY